MSSSNLIKLVLAIVIGIGLGLVYGWVIDPVEYIDVTPDVLREDYKVDYTLMVAEAYANDFDPALAAQRLAILGSEPPTGIVNSALEYANLNNFTQEEIRSLQNLLTAMQTFQPVEDIAP
ncbi:MAG: hypothetical protein JNK32_08305 [Anaerolineales bacterium]|nr:hypothetical protein [Anaerolineales bacterium]